MLLKSCRCGKLIPQSMKMCEECERQQQSRHMIYNNTRRDERAAEFYVSKEWRAMRERIIEVYDNVDIYALYVEHELLTCNPVHHIVELEDDWEQRLNPFNLIPLNHKTHNTITALYKQSKASMRARTQRMTRTPQMRIRRQIHRPNRKTAKMGRIQSRTRRQRSSRRTRSSFRRAK